MISIQNLYLKYIREYYALYDINLKIEKGEKVSFIGEEDSGKTSLLRVIAKLEKITSGSVYISGISISKINYKVDLSVGYLPVSPIFLRKKTVYENFEYLLKQRKFSKEIIQKQIEKTLKEFDIENLRNEKFEGLSLLNKYIVSLARISLRKLDLILIDNIFDKLQKNECDVIVKIIKEKFLSNKNLTSVIATSVEEIANQLSQVKFHFEYGSQSLVEN